MRSILLSGCYIAYKIVLDLGAGNVGALTSYYFMHMPVAWDGSLKSSIMNSTLMYAV